MAKASAGLLMYRFSAGENSVLLVHPGGPFWAKKDAGAWTIPKGELLPQEDPLTAAIREFHEETSLPSQPPYLSLGEAKQSSGKVVQAWAFAGDCDPSSVRSNTCVIEWPPRSGHSLTIPEIDRAAWFTLADARVAILKGQLVFLDRLQQVIDQSQP